MTPSKVVARNLLRGTKEGGWGTEVPVPQRGPGAEPRWGSGGEAPEA